MGATVEGTPLENSRAVAPRGSELSIVEFVARARRRRNLRSGVESASLGLAAALIAVAALLLSTTSRDFAPKDLLAFAACGALSGLAMAGTWWVERAKKTDLDLATQIDARLECQGALSTAFEACDGGDRSAGARWLERRVLCALDDRSLSRALPGPGWIWLAPPTMALALLAMVLEAPARFVAVGDANTLAASAGSMAMARARAAMALAREQHSAAVLDPRQRAQVQALLDAAAAELDQARAGTGMDRPGKDMAGELGRELANLRSELAQSQRPAPAGDSGSESPSGDAVATPGTESGAGSRADGDKSLLTNGSPDRTMVGSNRSTATSDGARRATEEPERDSMGEAGTIAGRWWPERYDPVVQGWRRALAARPGQH